MGRLFIKLYSFIALAAIVFFIGVANIDTLLHGTFENHLGNLTRGSHHLLEQRLRSQPEGQWDEILNEINQGGGYPLEVLPIDALSLPSAEIERLKNGEVVVAEIYQAKYIFQRVGDSQKAMQFPFEQSGYLHAQQLVNSTFNLIEQSLIARPVSHWPAIIEDLNPYFGFPVALTETEGIVTTEPRENGSRKSTVYDFSNDQELFFRKIGNSPYTLRLGPFDDPVTLTYLQMVMGLTFSFLVALAVFFWVFPLWRDIDRLSISARSFGQGDFSVRAKTSKQSVLFRLSSTFNDMASRIQRLISSHKELTNAVSHELRTPIARLRFGMEMLEMSADVEDRARYMNGMSDDIDELDQLVAELLTYARFDRVKPELEFQRLEVRPWLAEVIRQARFGVEGISIDFEISDPEFKYANFDPVLMARALGNLLQNAKRYTRTEIKVYFSGIGNDYQIRVDDDGPGIPEEDRAQIFDAFRRIDASRHRDTGGYGLGLSIVQRIVRWHGGEVSASSSPTGGASILMRWPDNEH